jgi:hypothetical protein
MSAADVYLHTRPFHDQTTDPIDNEHDWVSMLFAVGSPARPVLIVLVGGVYTMLRMPAGNALGKWLHFWSGIMAWLETAEKRSETGVNRGEPDL